MNPDAYPPTLAGCEAFQRQISEATDLGAPLTPAILAHLRSCADCAAFAEIWFPQPPAALARPVAVANDDRLRERILEAASLPEIIPFPVAARHRSDWMAWGRRAAACLALTALAWSLLNPKLSQVKTQTVAVAAPTLGQSLAQAEDHTKREQQVLQTALAAGGQRVHRDVAWTMSALEL